MTPTSTPISLQEALENAHKERATAFANLFHNWFGLRGLLASQGSTHHA